MRTERSTIEFSDTVVIGHLKKSSFSEVLGMETHMFHCNRREDKECWFTCKSLEKYFDGSCFLKLFL